MSIARIFLADGFEDMEALATRDVLIRGGVDARLVSITDSSAVKSSHGVVVCADEFLFQVEDEDSDVLVFPGGMPGSKNLAGCDALVSLARRHYGNGRIIAAICAAPGLVLGRLDCWDGTEFTCFDSFEAIPVSKGGRFVRKSAVRSGNVITGRSAGYSTDFGLEILKALEGEEKAAQVRSSLLLDID